MSRGQVVDLIRPGGVNLILKIDSGACMMRPGGAMCIHLNILFLLSLSYMLSSS